MIFVRDASKFQDFIHSQKRLPDTGLRSHGMQWEYWALSPESAHQVIVLMSDRGTPRTWRHMNGYSSHTFSPPSSRTAVPVRGLDDGASAHPARHAIRQRNSARGLVARAWVAQLRADMPAPRAPERCRAGLRAGGGSCAHTRPTGRAR